jgi:hypothetical protein
MKVTVSVLTNSWLPLRARNLLELEDLMRSMGDRKDSESILE